MKFQVVVKKEEKRYCFGQVIFFFKIFIAIMYLNNCAFSIVQTEPTKYIDFEFEFFITYSLLK